MKKTFKVLAIIGAIMVFLIFASGGLIFLGESSFDEGLLTVSFYLFFIGLVFIKYILPIIIITAIIGCVVYLISKRNKAIV